LNRRIIYNGASVYQTGHPNVGQPLAPQKWVVAWDAGGTVYRTPGNDVTDGFKPPGAAGARMPFIMQREGVAHLFGPGREDGPFPEHYEPWETVLTTNPISQTLTSPTNFGHVRPEAYEHPGHGNPEFPIVGTTYRVSEHWQAGQLTRNNPWLCELQPDAFVELSEELASILGISNGDMTEIKTKRSNVTSPSGNYGKTMQAVACVTKRFKPYTIAGDTIHHIGVIWHFGYTGYCTGDSANLLTPHIGDANTGIPESKAFICNLRKLGGSWLS
jgi:formate dehydrogenase major subunit